MNGTTYLSILKKRFLKKLPTLSPHSRERVGNDLLIFQQDGCSSHTAFDVIKYFNDREIEVLPWPAKSPDRNLIEEVWSRLKSKLKGSYNSTKELEEDVGECWESTL